MDRQIINATNVATQQMRHFDNGITYAYACRRFGKVSEVPIVLDSAPFLPEHLIIGTPIILSGLAQEREVIIFDNTGVAEQQWNYSQIWTRRNDKRCRSKLIEALGLKN